MNQNKNRADNVQIAYIGGGSRGWAWGFMTDLAQADDICGTVSLYDIDYEAAKHNEVIGNKLKELEGCKSPWNYRVVKELSEALTGADFVIISILPGTFDEMHSDVHTPEKYGIYQAVGDTTGPGGIVRALRTIPMYETIAEAIKEYCPKAWVINYTNPMAVCVNTLYRVFPEIKAFGCCHEVFGTQKFLAKVLKEECGIDGVQREEIKTNVVGVNHFTWLTSAQYKRIDIYPLYESFCAKYKESGYADGGDDNWANNAYASAEKVKMDLFTRFHYIAAAGDRHLAEFCNGSWYLRNPETVREMKFALTSVDFRKEDLKERLAKSERLLSGEEIFEFKKTGEDGVKQIRALLGLSDLVTNVNIPNRGQIPNLPMGVVVETNAVFRADTVEPIFAGPIPEEIYPMIAGLAEEQELTVRAGIERNVDLALNAFYNDPLVNIPLEDSKKLFYEMLENTKKYLGMYNW